MVLFENINTKGALTLFTSCACGSVNTSCADGILLKFKGATSDIIRIPLESFV